MSKKFTVEDSINSNELASSSRHLVHWNNLAEPMRFSVDIIQEQMHYESPASTIRLKNNTIGFLNSGIELPASLNYLHNELNAAGMVKFSGEIMQNKVHCKSPVSTIYKKDNVFGFPNKAVELTSISNYLHNGLNSNGALRINSIKLDAGSDFSSKIGFIENNKLTNDNFFFRDTNNLYEDHSIDSLIGKNNLCSMNSILSPLESGVKNIMDNLSVGKSLKHFGWDFLRNDDTRITVNIFITIECLSGNSNHIGDNYYN